MHDIFILHYCNVNDYGTRPRPEDGARASDSAGSAAVTTRKQTIGTEGGRGTVDCIRVQIFKLFVRSYTERNRVKRGTVAESYNRVSRIAHGISRRRRRRRRREKLFEFTRKISTRTSVDIVVHVSRFRLERRRRRGKKITRRSRRKCTCATTGVCDTIRYTRKTRLRFNRPIGRGLFTISKIKRHYDSVRSVQPAQAVCRRASRTTSL